MSENEPKSELPVALPSEGPSTEDMAISTHRAGQPGDERSFCVHCGTVRRLNVEWESEELDRLPTACQEVMQAFYDLWQEGRSYQDLADFANQWTLEGLFPLECIETEVLLDCGYACRDARVGDATLWLRFWGVPGDNAESWCKYAIEAPAQDPSWPYRKDGQPITPEQVMARLQWYREKYRQDQV